MTEPLVIDVPGYSGTGLAVEAESRIRVRDVEGQQAADLFALVREDPSELHLERTGCSTSGGSSEIQLCMFVTFFIFAKLQINAHLVTDVGNGVLCPLERANVAKASV